MRVIGKEKISNAKAVHPKHAKALDKWVALLEGCLAKNFSQLKSATYRSADYVKPYVVFDVAGNNLRVITQISFAVGQVTVEHVLDHKEYDKGNWK